LREVASQNSKRMARTTVSSRPTIEWTARFWRSAGTQRGIAGGPAGPGPPVTAPLQRPFLPCGNPVLSTGLRLTEQCQSKARAKAEQRLPSVSCITRALAAPAGTVLCWSGPTASWLAPLPWPGYAALRTCCRTLRTRSSPFPRMRPDEGTEPDPAGKCIPPCPPSAAFLPLVAAVAAPSTCPPWPATRRERHPDLITCG
jgi:hypothetical protein